MKNKGFTLIEVLVALVVLAIALSAVIKTTLESIQHYHSLEDRSVSHWVAMNLLASMQAGLIPTPEQEGQQGHSEMLNKTWYWTSGVDSAGSGATRVYIDVSVNPNGKPITHLIGFVPHTRVALP